jgi:predicted hotdog family 3-hydroxylacyl-ACP dehydratase
MRLDRDWIEKNIPHRGRMCLLDEIIEWDAQHVRCRSGTHRAPDNPLRSQGRLGVACGIEYAAQAMAVHGALAAAARARAVAGAGGITIGAAPPAAGFLAGLRDVELRVLRFDDLEADLICDALLLAGDGRTALYEFAVACGARPLLRGRATVVFDANERLKHE